MGLRHLTTRDASHYQMSLINIPAPDPRKPRTSRWGRMILDEKISSSLDLNLSEDYCERRTRGSDGVGRKPCGWPKIQDQDQQPVITSRVIYNEISPSCFLSSAINHHTHKYHLLHNSKRSKLFPLVQIIHPSQRAKSPISALHPNSIPHLHHQLYRNLPHATVTLPSGAPT